MEALGQSHHPRIRFLSIVGKNVDYHSKLSNALPDPCPFSIDLDLFRDCCSTMMSKWLRVCYNGLLRVSVGIRETQPTVAYRSKFRVS